MDDDARRVIALGRACESSAKGAPLEDVLGRAEAYAHFLAAGDGDNLDREELAQLLAELVDFIERSAPYYADHGRDWTETRRALARRAAEAIGNLRGEPPVKIVHAPLPEE